MKKTHRTLLALALIALVCAVPVWSGQAQAEESDANADMERFQSGVFSYAIPSSWSSKEEQTGGLAKHWHYAGEFGDLDSGYLYVYNHVLFITKAQEPETLDETVYALMNDASFVRLLYQENVTVAGCRAIRCAMLMEHDGTVYRGSFLFALYKSNLLSAMCLYPQEAAHEQEAFMSALSASIAVDASDSAGQARDEIDPSGAFANPERFQSGIFSYGMPSGWIAEEAETEDLLERWHYADARDYDEGWCFYVRVDPASGMSAQEELAYLEETLQVMREEADSLRVSYLEPLTVAGCDAIHCAFLIETGGIAESRSFLFLIHKDFLFTVMSFYPESGAKMQEALMNAFAVSVTLDENPVPSGQPD